MMRKFRFLIAAIVVATVVAPLRPADLAAAAGARTPSALLRCVQDRYGSLRDLSATFSQESLVASLWRSSTRNGLPSAMAASVCQYWS